MFLYDVERGPDGRMVTKPPPAEWPDPRALHARRCFLLGITEAWKVEKLWGSK